MEKVTCPACKGNGTIIHKALLASFTCVYCNGYGFTLEPSPLQKEVDRKEDYTIYTESARVNGMLEMLNSIANRFKDGEQYIGGTEYRAGAQEVLNDLYRFIRETRYAIHEDGKSISS